MPSHEKQSPRLRASKDVKANPNTQVTAQYDHVEIVRAVLDKCASFYPNDPTKRAELEDIKKQAIAHLEGAQRVMMDEQRSKNQREEYEDKSLKILAAVANIAYLEVEGKVEIGGQDSKSNVTYKTRDLFDEYFLSNQNFEITLSKLRPMTDDPEVRGYEKLLLGKLKFSSDKGHQTFSSSGLHSSTEESKFGQTGDVDKTSLLSSEQKSPDKVVNAPQPKRREEPEQVNEEKVDNSPKNQRP